MIKSGKLDRQIDIEWKKETVGSSGSVTSEWLHVSSVRAELVQRSADEYLTGYGEAESRSAVFLIRYQSGITTADRVVWRGVAYDIDEIVELGRRRGLELRTVAK
ncbi:phage head closure protein [Shimia thalassica]|uniref:phage head closure protein n=1 Tax=Shimia thalassica TaxID=1715693 RepID=UPI0026E496B7|nr:phage head closure protein [Shimia thalassica]MDO6521284.1 phage head closure protein [Shimia thalassica]